MIKKYKDYVPWKYFICDFNGEEIDGTFLKKELQETNQAKFTVEKVIKRKDNKLFVKWKDHDNLFNSWLGKKDNVI